MTAKALVGDTGLAADDVFYFGNAVGDTGAGNTAGYAIVNATDQIAARNNATATAGVGNVYDFNRDGRVDAADELVVKQNGATIATALKLFTPPAPSPAVPSKSPVRAPIFVPFGSTPIAAFVPAETVVVRRTDDLALVPLWGGSN